MDAFLDTIVQILINWGILGLFLSALLAGSVFPFSSELVLVAVAQAGLNPWLCLLAATAGNVLGGMTCYWMGHLGKLEWVEKHFHIKKEKVMKMEKSLQGKGAWMAIFAFLPIIGSVLSVALGFMRANVPITVVAMAIGKFIRYAIILFAVNGAISALF